MLIDKGPFPSKSYALGFVQGVEYTNDSALQPMSAPWRNSRGWFVTFEDTDQDEALLEPERPEDLPGIPV